MASTGTSTQQRLVLIIAILARRSSPSWTAPVINGGPARDEGEELGGGITTQQWVVDAYLITLGSLILLAGSLSDLFGRKVILDGGAHRLRRH